MRTFLAIPVPEEIKQLAQHTRENLASVKPDVKWVEFENYHLTLKFLGDIKPELLEPLARNLQLAGESCPSFRLFLKHIGFFPSPNRPRVIWLGMDGETEKAGFLGERVDAYLSNLGFESEKKRSFHLTLGRIRSDHNQEKLLEKSAVLNKAIEKRGFAVSEFHLMESRLSSSGPQYSVLRAFRLDG